MTDGLTVCFSSQLGFYYIGSAFGMVFILTNEAFAKQTLSR